MQNRIIELASDPVRLRVRNRLLEVRSDAGVQASIPVADVAVVVAAQPQVTFTHAVLGSLAEAGGVFVVCDPRRQPIGMMLPLDGYHHQAKRFRAQAAATAPLRKRTWQRIVRAKIAGQASVLTAIHGDDRGLTALIREVKSGDTTNVEARAARRYWSALFDKSFRRDRDAENVNLLLNYGYGVLRAIVARAICASGLHPGLGLHHHHRESGFPLADDLMEPFRPILDLQVRRLSLEDSEESWSSSRLRREVVNALIQPYTSGNESRTLFDWAGQCSSSLAASFENCSSDLRVPVF